MAPALDLNHTLGALLIGVVVSAALFGVTCLQAFYYFQNYSSDKILVKLFVVLVLTLETLHSVLGTYSVYYYTITNYGNPSAFFNPNWSLSIVPAQLSVVVVAVQLFYARRVYYVSRKNVQLVIVILFFALARFGVSILVTVKAFQVGSFGSVAQMMPYITTSIALTVAADMTIAASLSYYLHKSRNGVRNTDAMINRLIVHAINNGILTSVFDIVVLVLATVFPQNMVFFSIYQVISNLYANSVLATLNSRRFMGRTGNNTGISFRLPGSTFTVPAMNESGSSKSDVAQVKAVRHDSALEDTTSHSM